MPTFAAQYGPWALVAGASEGVGALYAEELAARGLNVVVLARRQAALDEVAAGIRSRTGAEVRTLAVDLARPDATATITTALADLEIGYLVYCAGADADYRPLLAGPVAAADAMIHRNCTVMVQLCHAFAGPMVERGRGAIVLFGSGAGFAGAPNMAVYGATKAFDMVFAEGLYGELRPHGVDVLGLVLGETDTPGLRRVRHQRGLSGPDEPVRRASTPEQVVADAFAHLTDGPVYLANRTMRLGSRAMFPMGRNRMARLMARASAKAMGPAD
ncbi:SDR family NAD(P)-dependent oxidoreductase [Nocardioides stalactiti]|uniref:SDR family NAD(P)-dependent oxidoreductase n=1 Tax=Nocardioides stalactiti TaxID=2755356 RepID=UPI0015FF929A|nr:SDR family NAD(P)-dependent oxidoreductase [Nocardioides stalactiti]